MQNIVVIGRVYSKLEHSEFSSNFEFDRNMLSGTGAWFGVVYEVEYYHGILSLVPCLISGTVWSDEGRTRITGDQDACYSFSFAQCRIHFCRDL